MSEESNSSKIILDLCGGTGSWSKPYKDAGYDVRVITMPQFDVTDFTFDSDTAEITFPSSYGNDLTLYVPDIHGILAAPPCTMFSRARSTGPPRDFTGAMQVVSACLSIIWTCRAENKGGKHHHGLKFWALENPMGLLRQFIGNPPFSFEPWQYGDMHFKFTDIWGYFKEPKQTHHIRPREFDRSKWANPPLPEEFSHLKLDRAARRAITPQGFARAFYEANK